MSVSITISVSDVVATKYDKYKNITEDGHIREEEFKIQADTLELAVAKAQRILEIV